MPMFLTRVKYRLEALRNSYRKEGIFYFRAKLEIHPRGSKMIWEMLAGSLTR